MVDAEGTLAGPDKEAVALISSSIGVPVTYSGGISSLDDISEVAKSGVSGIAAGAYFVYYGPHRAVLVSYPSQDELEIALGGRR